MINLYNVDCMEFMRGLPDKCYELAIVDPPYGIGEDGLKNHSRGKSAKSKKYIPKNWDKEPPNEAYFKEQVLLVLYFYQSCRIRLLVTLYAIGIVRLF